MKKLTKFILISYASPLFRSFGVSLFILVVQFLSRYKSDLFGKGLEAFVILKIFAYASVSLVVLALPVAVLLSSLFTMGNFGENYELAAMRAAGLPLKRILRPMIVATLGITLFSFVLSSWIVPQANLKLYSLLWDVQQLKPAFVLKPGHFNTDIDHYVIRIEGKNTDREMLYDVMIYDHTDTLHPGNNRVVFADSANMEVDPYGRYMNMTMYHGTSHEKVLEKGSKGESESHMRFYFDTLYYNFDLEGFSLERTEERAFASHQYMLTLPQLFTAIDSLDSRKEEVAERFGKLLAKMSRVDSNFVEMVGPETGTIPPDQIIFQFDRSKRLAIMQTAIRNSMNVRSMTVEAKPEMEKQRRAQREREVELHSKFALPLACLIFLFIGAPLGALIRKGGVGIPIVVSVTMYLAFYVIMIQGKKVALENAVPVWVGAWLPILVMSPLAFFFTFDSLSQRRLLTGENFWQAGKVLGWILTRFNPLYWLLRIPAVNRVAVTVLRPVYRFFFRRRKNG